MNQLYDLREWLVSKLNDSVEIAGEDELILGFIRKLDAAPPATAAPLVEETAIGHARYEYIRTLNPRKFSALYNEALMGVHQFDDLVDRYRDAEERPE